MKDNELERSREEKLIIEKFKGIKSEDMKVHRLLSRFISRICEIHEYENDSL